MLGGAETTPIREEAEKLVDDFFKVLQDYIQADGLIRVKARKAATLHIDKLIEMVSSEPPMVERELNATRKVDKLSHLFNLREEIKHTEN